MQTPHTAAAALLLDNGLPFFLDQCTAYGVLDSAIAVCDTHGKLRYANPAFSRFNQNVRDSADSLGKHASLFDCPALHSWIQHTLSGANSSSLRQIFYYAPRITVELSLFARVLHGTDGSMLGLLLTLGEESIEFERRHIAKAQDTQRTLAERIKLLNRDKIVNDQLIRVLLKEAPFAMLLMNSERQIFQVNRAAEKLFGSTAAQMLGKSCEQFLPCYQQCNACPVLDQQKTIDAVEIIGNTAGQQAIPLLRSVALVKNDIGDIVVEAFIDLSERKETEQALSKLSEFNQLLVESTGEGIFSVDLNLICTFANQAAAHMLGYTQDELIGKDIHALFHHRREDGSELPRAELPIMKVMSEQRGEKADDVFWAKDNHAVPVQYLCNPLHENGAVVGAVIVYRDVAEARALARKMDYLAAHDPLTGLPNRRTFEQRLEHLLAKARTTPEQHVLCYIDLDQFKIVNDTCGHAAGDELRRQISDMLHKRIRKSDLFARLGGDEFGLLLESCSLNAGIKLIEELLGLLREYRFAWNGKSFALGASIGVVQLDNSFVTEGKALSAADSACYVAKEQGRNRIHVYQHNDNDLVQRQGEMEWITRIKEALDKNLFELWMQPIVAVEDARETGRHMEILLRMQGGNAGIINPGAFIPAAERFGLMSELDRWVVRQTLLFLSENLHCMPQLDLCCINLSGPSITDDKFLEFLLEQFSIHPRLVPLICLEITETAAVSNLARAALFMRKLKEVGCKFALDDFGSGMSSFAYLKNLPVDFLKIDGHFVRDMASDKVDYAMVEAIHRVGNVMGIKTVAEFVENDDILSHLRDIGVNYAQGYAISKPAPLQHFLKPNPGPAGSASESKSAA